MDGGGKIERVMQKEAAVARLWKIELSQKCAPPPVPWRWEEDIFSDPATRRNTKGERQLDRAAAAGEV